MKNIILFLSFSLGLFVSSVFAQTNFNYTQTCYGNQTTLVASSSLADTAIASWQWDLDNNGTYDISGKTIITLFATKDTNIVKLRITPKYSAADSISKTVIIDPLPLVNFVTKNLCAGKPAIYVSKSTIASGSITQYLWDFNNDGITDNNSGDSVSYTCGPAANYTSKLTCVSNKGCYGFTQKITSVYPNPSASFTTSNFCLNNAAVFTNTSIVSNPDFYIWNFGDGNQATTSGNATHLYATTGTYTVTLVASTQNGCRDTTSLPTIILSIPVASISGNTVVCANGSTTLTASGGVTYSWFTGETDAVITVAPSSSTSYSVAVVNGNGCSNTTFATVNAAPLPLVSITSSSTVIPPGGGLTLIANGAMNYSWNTGSHSISISTDSAGIFSVVGTDANGCLASSSFTVSTENPDSISVSSNILTPNDDNINDALIINNISAYSSCDLKIYNMWNDEVYSVTGYKNNWKGTNSSGAVLPAGAYYYIIKCDDKPLQKGNINILH